VEPPGNVLGWIIMAFSCIGTGYLEESYFRYYLLTKLQTRLPSPAARMIISTVLFSFCHIYEGPWGILNAVLAGLFLSMLFIRYRSIHGIAWAHGAYNIFVYIMGFFMGI
jgi:membrane protease YdiL (CAAX protease family)